MSTHIVQCPKCEAKNRLQAAGDSNKHPRCGRCGNALPWLLDATDATFDQETESPLPILVDLWAPWCQPCLMVAPVLAELARDFAGQLKVLKVNVDENPQLSSRFNARSIPLLLVMKGGEVRENLVGVQPKAALQEILTKYL